MTQDLRVTIRLLPDKKDVYKEFKRNVIDLYHSDICYVMTSLMEAFNTATLKTPNPNDQITMTFLKQNVQVNIGCNFNYNVKKARRIQTETDLTPNKNIAWPNFIEQWPNMTQQNRQFWITELQNKGIIPPTRDKSHTMLHALKKFISWVRRVFHRK